MIEVFESNGHVNGRVVMPTLEDITGANQSVHETPADFQAVSAEEIVANLDHYEQTDPGMIVVMGVHYAARLKKMATADLSQHLLVGEDQAIEEFIKTPLKGGTPMANTAWVSPFGAGKTDMLEHGFKVFGMDNVAYVPITPELRPSDLMGSKSEMTKTIQNDGEETATIERLTGEKEGILDTSTQVLVIDEANRGNPRTLGAAANAVGSRKIELSKGNVVPLTELEMVMFAFNPQESLATTSKLPEVIAARVSSASILAEEERWDNILDGFKNFQHAPEMVRQAITRPQLRIAQAAMRHIEFDEVHPFAAEMTKKVLYGLRDNEMAVRGALPRIGEAPGRVYLQLQTDAKARAMMNGRGNVVEDDIELAATSKMTAALVCNGISDLNLVRPIVEDSLAGKYSK
jgi:MoxR-like ATPase